MYIVGLALEFRAVIIAVFNSTVYVEIFAYFAAEK